MNPPLGFYLSMAAFTGGVLMLSHVVRPEPRYAHGPLPRDANACLKAGMKLVIDFKQNRISCEEP